MQDTGYSLLVAGPRNLEDDALVAWAIRKLRTRYVVTRGMHGGCRGADAAAGHAFAAAGIPVSVYPAQWERYGRAAGPMRSRSMVDLADIVLIVNTGPEVSTAGTMHTYNYALARCTRVFVAWRHGAVKLIERRATVCTGNAR